MRKTIQRAVCAGVPRRAALLLVCALAAFAALGRAAHAATAVSSPAASARVLAPFAIADFDGDNQPDLATVQAGQISSSQTRYWVRFQLSTGTSQDISVTAPAGGLEIASRDVNGDSILDLVVTTAWLKQPVAVLLNDGHGHFTNADPRTFAEIWKSPWSWDSPSSLEQRGAIAPPPVRSLTSDSTETEFLLAPPYSLERLAPGSADISFSPALGFAQGRAPPAFALPA